MTIMKDHEIYVLLTDTGTVLNRTIKWFTKDPLNHASIAFDRKLTDVYSFGRKTQNNPFFAGFVKEDMNWELFKHATCEVYCCKVSTQVYNNIRNQILDMERNHAQYKYNLIGMLALLLNVEIKRDHAYFCSQFVASVFENNGIHLINKSSLLATPGDLVNAPDLQLIYKGKLRHYIKPTRITFKRTRTA